MLEDTEAVESASAPSADSASSFSSSAVVGGFCVQCSAGRMPAAAALGDDPAFCAAGLEGFEPVGDFAGGVFAGGGELDAGGVVAPGGDFAALSSAIL